MLFLGIVKYAYRFISRLVRRIDGFVRGFVSGLANRLSLGGLCLQWGILNDQSSGFTFEWS